MKTFLAIKSLVWYTIFAFDYTYDKDIWTMGWLLLAIISTITYLQVWISDKIEEQIKKIPTTNQTTTNE